MQKAVNPLIFGGFIKEAMRMKSFKTLRMVITIVDVVCLLAVLFVPALEAAKHNFFAWLILGLLTLYVLFMWLVLGRRNNSGYDAESDREADISKELLSQRNKWYM